MNKFTLRLNKINNSLKGRRKLIETKTQTQVQMSQNKKYSIQDNQLKKEHLDGKTEKKLNFRK